MLVVGDEHLVLVGVLEHEVDVVVAVRRDVAAGRADVARPATICQPRALSSLVISSAQKISGIGMPASCISTDSVMAQPSFGYTVPS